MAHLTDYLDLPTLQKLQDDFSAVAGQPVQICTPDGDAVTRPSTATAVATENQAVAALRLHKSHTPPIAPGPQAITVDGETLGIVKLQAPATANECCSETLANILPLMSNTLSELCKNAALLRSRVEQAIVLYRVTGEITAGRDMQTILNTATSAVTRAIGAKSSTVRLLAENGQSLELKSGYNVSAKYLDKGAIRLDESQIDREAVATSKPVYIANMATDPRVLYSAEAQAEGFISGLCVPMLHREQCAGLMRIYTDAPHEFDWFETELACTVANAAATALAHAEAESDAEQAWELKRQLAMAGEVQQRMIPQTMPQLDGLEIHGRYLPQQELAGDFYDLIQMPNDLLGVTVTDVVGKGVRASLMMASVCASLRGHALSGGTDVATILEKVNRDMCSDTEIADFATMFYGVIDLPRRVMHFSCAGHMPPLLYRDRTIHKLEARAGVIGMFEDTDYPVSQVELKPGDVILIYTDGLNEAANFNAEQFGSERIAKSLHFAASNDYSAEAVADYCLWDMHRFVGLEPTTDDTTLVVLKVK